MTGIEHPSLLRDTGGVTAVEFALIAPALFIVLFGLFDLGYNMYTAEMLNGAIQKAARDSTIQGAGDNSATLDAIVTRAVKAVAPSASLTFSRKSYSNFTGVGRPEDWDDVNANGICDAGETFEDANHNGTWDRDVGQTGFGSARDAVLYTVTVTYARAFPLAAFIPGQTRTLTMSSTTVLRNQPYGQQNANAAPTTGTCA
jgi:Flp pilus assembly protein TadG